MWLFYAFLSGGFFTISGLVSRYLLKGKQDSWGYSFWYSFFGAIVSLPFMLVDLEYSTKPLFWAGIALVASIIVIHNLLSFKSLNYITPSVQGALTKLRLIWVFVFGVVFLGDEFSYLKLLGTVLIIAAGVFLASKLKAEGDLTGILLAILATIFYAAGIALYSPLFKEFSVATLTFLIFMIPAAINLAIMPNSISRIRKVFVQNPVLVILSTGLGGIANLTMNKALSFEEEQISVVVVIECFLIVTLSLEHFVLKEKTKAATKLLAVLLALVGALLVKLS